MAEVTATDISRFQDQLNDYRRRATEAKEDAEQQAKLNEERRQDQVNALERRQAENLAKNEAELHQTMTNFRQNSDENAARSQSVARDEIARLNQEIYDRHGRNRSQSADLREERDYLQKEIQEQSKRSNQQQAAIQSLHSQSMASRESDHAKEMEYLADEMRQAGKRDVQFLSDQYNNDFASDRAEMQKDFDEMNRQSLESKRMAQKEALHAIQENQEEYRRLRDKVQTASANRVANAIQGMERKNQDQLLTQQKAFANEAAELRQVNNQLVNLKDEYRKGYSEGRSEGYSEIENEANAEKQYLWDNLQEILAKQESKSDEKETYLAESKNSALQEQQTYFQKMISKQNNENQDALRNMLNEFQIAENSLHDQRRRQEELHDQSLSQAEVRNRENREKALSEQAQAYSAVMARNTSELQSSNDALSDELVRVKNSPRLADISPAAEQKMREQYYFEEMATYRADEARNARATEQLQRNYQEKYEDLLSDSNRAIVQAHRDKTLTEDNTRKMVNRMRADDDQLRSGVLDDQRRELEGQNHLQQRAASKQLDLQSRIYEDKFTAMRLNHDSDLQNLRTEYEFREQDLRRDASFALNEKRRELEKVIREMAEDHRLELDEQIAVSQAEMDRQATHFRSEIDKQKLDFERQIAQLEAQQSERERLQNSNFEERLAEMRRTNERLLRQKG